MALFLVDSCSHAAGETFRVLIRDPALIAEAENLIGAGNQRIVIGNVVAGDGGFNSPWSWHLDPDSVSIAESAIEVCSGCASFVENDRDNWIATVGQYCPWGTVFLERQQ